MTYHNCQHNWLNKIEELLGQVEKTGDQIVNILICFFQLGSNQPFFLLRCIRDSVLALRLPQVVPKLASRPPVTCPTNGLLVTGFGKKLNFPEKKILFFQNFPFTQNLLFPRFPRKKKRKKILAEPWLVTRVRLHLTLDCRSQRRPNYFVNHFFDYFLGRKPSMTFYWRSQYDSKHF